MTNIELKNLINSVADLLKEYEHSMGLSDKNNFHVVSSKIVEQIDKRIRKALRHDEGELVKIELNKKELYQLRELLHISITALEGQEMHKDDRVLFAKQMLMNTII